VKLNANVEMGKLNAAIKRVTALTGKELETVIGQAGIIFTRSAGKAMPPRGRWAHPAKARRREIFELSCGQYFNRENGDPAAVRGRRRRGQDAMYGVMVGAPKSRKRKRILAWQKSVVNKERRIESRGVAKGQFWRAMEQQGQSSPRGAYMGVKARHAAAASVTVSQGKGFLMPFIQVDSDIRTAEKYRPIAVKIGLKDAAKQVAAWGRRLAKEQERAFA
jgi:hypothetical protein